MNDYSKMNREGRPAALEIPEGLNPRIRCGESIPQADGNSNPIAHDGSNLIEEI